MPSPIHGFPWRPAVCFIAACWLLAGQLVDLMADRGSALLGKGGGHVAEVHGRPVTRLELQQAMREHLWRRNEAWAALGGEARKQTRRIVLENLVHARLLRSFRVMDGIGTPPPMADVRRESDQMRRQFADVASFSTRLTAQQHTQKSLDESIRDSQLDEEWLREKTARRVAEVTVADAQGWYDEFGDTLRIPQACHVAHLFLTRHDKTKPDRAAEMRGIHHRLMAGEKSFAALVSEHSEDERTKKTGGDLGWFTRKRMPADFMTAVEALAPGQFSKPVLTRLGWHILLVKERRESRLPVFAECRDEISAMLTGRRREDAVRSLIAGLRERSRQPAKTVIYHPEVIDRAEPAP
ncbi:MAG: peptidylprolyl isomerase [Verrucomicrobiaceae bacterium]|nr:peptidylprolyl isomerase [Verrucomicrobiaceae bacterium]